MGYAVGITILTIIKALGKLARLRCTITSVMSRAPLLAVHTILTAALLVSFYLPLFESSEGIACCHANWNQV